MARRIGLAIALGLACDWFSLREPEPPSGYGSWEYPDEPEKVLSNLESALEVDLSPQNYMLCFSQDFYFYADPSLSSGPGGEVYEDWTRETEDTVIGRLMASLDLSNPTPVEVEITVLEEDPGAGQWGYRLAYWFLFYSGGQVLYAEGEGIVRLVESGGFWSISEWQDYRLDTTSWAELKVGFR